MLTIERLARLLGILALLLLIFAFQAFIGLIVISALIVPMTYLYSLISGRSYNSVIDSSNMLYKLNIFGQWSLVIMLCLLVAYLVVMKTFTF